MSQKNFGQVVDFLNRHVKTIVLGQDDGAQIVVVPQYQGRTMTSTAGGRHGNSYGWINEAHIESGKIDPVVNLYGGEDRFWISPEGGQYSVFFEPDAPMEFAHWRAPSIIDTEPFEVIFQDAERVQLQQRGTLVNYSRFQFDLQFDREVVLLDSKSVENHLGCTIDGLQWVGHESRNQLTNVGQLAWTPESGLIGIWVLNMNNPSPRATVLVPFKHGDVDQLGPVVNADYFGALDSDRLVVDPTRHLIYFLGDGMYRSKLGLTYDRVEDYMGSWDPVMGVLTVAQFNLPESAPHGYNNNLWEIQEQPYRGDVINSYNDGPNDSGGMLGPFFELETISPALALSPGESYTHIHRTLRFEGPRDRLDEIARHVFGVGLDEIEKQFSSNVASA